MAQDILIDSIQFIGDLYPRGGFDQETVNRYRQSIDFLPPIEVTHEHILIDGYHRLIAHRIEQRKTIKANIEHLDRVDVLWEAARRNAAHGLQLSLADKKRLARAFFSNGKHRTQSEIANLLKVSTGSINNWVRKLKQAQDQERNENIWQMWLACETQQVIADGVGLSRSHVAEIVGKLKDEFSDNVPDSLQTFNLWRFNDNDSRYGIDYPGRIPGQIVENVLYYYTEPFDTVVDPMAGGGTTIDVCKTMSRRWRAYDIKPVRDDIKKHSITNGFPAECRGCDLIFFDPPYWKQKKGDYSAEGENLANLSLGEFYDRLKAVLNSAYDVLADGGHIALIVGPTQEKGIIFDHAMVINQILNYKFSFVNRVIVPYTTQQAKPYHVAQARDGRYMLKLYRDLLIYRKTNDHQN